MYKLSKFDIYKDCLTLSNELIKSRRNFPKELMYDLGSDMLKHGFELLDEVVFMLNAFDKSAKLAHARRALDELQIVETRVLMAADNHCMDDVHMGWYIDTIPGIRSQLEGFANSLARQSGAATAAPVNLRNEGHYTA